MVAARARVLSNPGVDALRLWVAEPQSTGFASQPAARRAAAWYTAALASSQMPDFAAARTAHAKLDEVVRGDAAALPLADGAVDLAICAQVYEHVADAEALAAEVYRVLAPGGVCFFSGPNRWDPLERHYGLLFLSWLPRAVAHAYVRAAGRGERYMERPRSWWGLKRLWRGFTLQDYTVAAIRDPLRFQVVDELGSLAWVGRAPLWVLRALLPLYPNYNWVLRKPGEGPP